MSLPENITAILDGHEARGEPIPDQYRHPEVLPEAQFYLSAFWALQHDRHLGFGGGGGIPFSAIDRYARRVGLRDDEFWVFEDMIRACDGEWLKHNAEKSDPKKKRAAVSSQPLTPQLFDAMFG